MKRGEIWLADLGYRGKIRPILILSVPPGDDDRALFSYVIRMTTIRGTAYEVLHQARGMEKGAFDGQGIGTTDKSRLIRRLGVADAATLSAVKAAVRAWLGPVAPRKDAGKSGAAEGTGSEGFLFEVADKIVF